MAPLPPIVEYLFTPRTTYPSDRTISDLGLSSLELDLGVSHHSKRSASEAQEHTMPVIAARDLPATTAGVQPRDATTTYSPGSGAMSPESFHNAGILALFAIIGASMVVASLWFFFWARNGGFHFQRHDWDDYKSTVLRRKGPDGKTLSNATKSTKLGGGTIAGTQYYQKQKSLARSVVGHDEKGRKGIRAKRGWAKTHSVLYSDDYMTDSFGTATVSDEMTEVRSEPDHGHHSKRHRDRDVQQYKKEKVARVGGLNRVADSSHFDSSNTDRSEVMTESSEQPILSKEVSKQKEKERAERKARAEATRMERRWKKEAEEAAAALARESIRAVPPPPSAVMQKQRRESHSASPKKPRQSRDFSQAPTVVSEGRSVGYTETNAGSRTPSYYENYRPRPTESPRYSSDPINRSRQSSPRKKTTRREGAGGGGYRRGAGQDSELD